MNSRLKTCKDSDGSSWVEPGAGCLPGCLPVFHNTTAEDDSEWCAPDRAKLDWCEGKPWRADDLSAMLGMQPSSNQTTAQLILDSGNFRNRQPHSVIAIFSVVSDNDGGEAARALHLSFLNNFPERTAENFPLLEYDPNEPTAPFGLAPQRTFAGSADVARGSSAAMGSKPPPPPPPPRGQPVYVDDPCDARNRHESLMCRGYG
jgi:hypothetical protein